MTDESLDVTRDRKTAQISRSFEGMNKDWQANRDLDEATFPLVCPRGVGTDHAKAKPRE